jgi:hypothetical protein
VQYKFLTGLLSAVILIYLAFELLGVRLTTSDHLDATEANFPPGGPAEFLYLDEDKVAAYLAQVNGGTFDAETITSKLTDSLNAKVTVPGAGEGGGSQGRETSVQREVKPTDTSNFFSLRSGLIEQGELEEVGLRYFRKGVRLLDPGTFVTFKTTGLLSPQYLNAYLAVREDHTISAMFPASKRRRAAAKDFFSTFGLAPRVTFALRPRDAVGSDAVPKPFVYLLPMDASRLTAERSLLKYGGGQFTVLGKLVRIFPEKKRDHDPAYIESATREIWEQPLRRAPGELLCRTDHLCSARVRKGNLPSRTREKAVEAARARALAALARQTQIKREGAVILPIAIYK